jgi:hypothetical protein
MTTSYRNSGPQGVASVKDPIWLAALVAARCSADDGSEGHSVCWNWISGRAVYTNAGLNTERIEPLGVDLQTGQTLAVSWMPGDTTYTLKVYWQIVMAGAA